jgi:hypothetical protein
MLTIYNKLCIFIERSESPRKRFIGVAKKAFYAAANWMACYFPLAFR